MRIALFLLVAITLISCTGVDEEHTIAQILEVNSEISRYVSESTKRTHVSYTLGETVDGMIEEENATTWVDLDAQRILITAESMVGSDEGSERTEQSLYVEGGDLYMRMLYEPYPWVQTQSDMPFETLVESLVSYVPVTNLFEVLEPKDLTITDRRERYVLEVERQKLLAMQFGELFQEGGTVPEDMTITMTLFVNRNTLFIEELASTLEGSVREGAMKMNVSQTARSEIGSVNEILTIERPFDDEELLTTG